MVRQEWRVSAIGSTQGVYVEAKSRDEAIKKALKQGKYGWSKFNVEAKVWRDLPTWWPKGD